MNKTVSSMIILALLLMCTLTFSVKLQVGKAQPSTITVPDDYPTIQEAINNANNGDTVFVKSGVYQEPTIMIDKSVSLIGQDKETTIISGVYRPRGAELPPGFNHLVIINADNVTIKGFTFQYGFAACRVRGSGCLISDSKFMNNNDGVSLEAGGNTVSDCFFYESDDCSIPIISDNNTLLSNVVQKAAFAGIVVQGGSSNRIVGNEISECADSGIVLDMYSVNNIVAQNDITSNGWEREPSRNLNLWNSGIVLNVYAESNQIVKNNVSYNRCGLSERLGSNNNLIYHNSFINNQVQVEDVDIYQGICVNLWDNGYPSGGNYWSDYIGTDLYSGQYQNITGSDGRGDTKYVVDADNVDHYPLMNPYASPPLQVSVILVAGQVCLGESLAVNSTVVGGESTYSYQWYVNDTPVSGANSSSWTFAPQQIGNYSICLDVTDSLGDTAKSNQASIAVVYLLGDLNGDGIVDMQDIGIVARAFMTSPGDPRWSPAADINGDGIVDVMDIALIAQNFMDTHL